MNDHDGSFRRAGRSTTAEVERQSPSIASFGFHTREPSGSGVMWQAWGKPVGLGLVAGLIALEGLGLVGASIQLMLTAPEEWIASAASAAIGALLVRKAYKLWNLHRTAWLLVIVASALGGAVHTVEIARGHGAPGTWFAAAWALVTVAYLTRPAVRALFVHSR